MVSLADVRDAVFEPLEKDQADKDSLKIIGLISVEAHLYNACFQFSKAADALEGGFEEAEIITDPDIKISAIHVLAETYNDARDDYRRIGFDLG